MSIAGTAPDGNKIQVFYNSNVLSTIVAKDGKYSIYLPIVESDKDEITYTVKNDESSVDILVKSKMYLQNLASKKDSENKESEISSYSSSSRFTYI